MGESIQFLEMYAVLSSQSGVGVFSLVLGTIKSMKVGREGIYISLCIRKRLGEFYRCNHLPVNKDKRELQTEVPLLFRLVLFLT